MKKVKSGSDISFSFNVKVTDKTTVDEIIREASDIIKVRFAEYKVEPEESEDERMMRVIGLALTDVPEERFVSLGTTLKDCLACLKKQKEQKPVISKEAIRDGVAHFGITQYQIDNWLKKHINIVEQKPAGKQDYSGLTDLERAIHRGFLVAGVENVPITIIKQTAQECLEQMKPAEWSEEDEKMVRFYEDDYNNNLGNMPMRKVIESRIEFKDWLLNRFKSLRPQSHWKPCEEQMEAVRFFVNKHQSEAWAATGQWKQFTALRGLLGDLQKMM